ncbi:MAG: DNA-directed RNA polymerase subunit alpha [Bacteroidia bacterium]|jgi:DNA-directed RNA polymerase subunit alpha|nr:DNA-directed RNA polymerase subunit alpha [Bacteroidia bacterium]
MAILAFQKPDKVIMTSSSDTEGEFEFKPLEPGYGITIGNALRRILLSSLEGYAISSIKIQGVDHEFTTIKGVMEDITEIILNLKQVRFKKQIEGTNTEKVTISITDKDEFTAGDIGKFTSAFQVLNPELVICRMDSNVKLKIDLTIIKGRGYIPAEENKPLNGEIGLIPIDSIFTPIKNVRYNVENFRVEQKTDYEKLLLTVTTDGSIHPKEALKEAAKILIYHFALFSDEKITLDLDSKKDNEELDENDLRIRQLLKTKLVDMDLSVRALNCLKAAEVATLGQLVQFNKNDLLKFRNFGKKSLTEIEDMIRTKGLNFGMAIEKYGLDKE